MANVKAVRSGFWIQKKNGIVQICESVVSLSRTDRGKCEGGEKWFLGSKNKIKLTDMRGSYRHSHAWIMANVDGINEVGFRFEKQIKIYEYARVFAPLPHMDGGKCE